MTATNGHAAAKAEAQTLTHQCLATYRLCREAAAHAAIEDRTVRAELENCADLHLTTANFLLRASPFNRELAALTAAVAKSVADTLEPLEQTDSILRAAYAACLRTYHACAAWMGAESSAVPTPPDARDVALEETFPASDPPPPPTEL